MVEAYFDYGLEQDGEVVYLHNRMRYRVGMGPLGRLLDRLVLHGVIAGSVRDATLSQKLFYETGVKVTPEALKKARTELAGNG